MSRNEVTLGINPSTNKLRVVEMLPVKSVSILSKNPKTRTELMVRFLNDFLTFDDIENIKLFIIDSSKSLFLDLNDNLSKHTLKYSYDLKEIIILMEIIYEEVRNRKRILKENGCHDLESYEILKKSQDSSYKNPDVFYIVINDLDSLRLRLGEESRNKLDYFDYLLENILDFYTEVQVGILISNRSTQNTYYPKDIYYKFSLKIGKDLEESDYTNYFDIGQKKLKFKPYHDKIYVQESYNILEKLEDDFGSGNEVTYKKE